MHEQGGLAGNGPVTPGGRSESLPTGGARGLGTFLTAWSPAGDTHLRSADNSPAHDRL